MNRPPIKYTAQGLAVTLFTDGSPRTLTVENEWPNSALRMHGTAQIRALHWMLGEILAADPHPDDRPRP